MNDKWNPRLWLRNWLNKESKTEARDRKRFEADLADFRDGDAGTSAAAQRRLEAAGFTRPISACDFTLDVQEGRVVGLKKIAGQSEPGLLEVFGLSAGMDGRMPVDGVEVVSLHPQTIAKVEFSDDQGLVPRAGVAVR